MNVKSCSEQFPAIPIMDNNSITPARIYTTSLLLFILMGSSGCSLIKTGLASLKSTSDFRPLKADSRVLAEPGAEDLAKSVAKYLPEAIAMVEKSQYRPFAKPVEVYVCASEDSFAGHTGLSKQTRGALTTKVFLSGRLMRPEFRETTRAILVHELSHLHLQQRLGVYAYNAKLPAWFQEGLAVLVSGGGGAETVNDDNAGRAILKGMRFTPETKGSFFFHKSAKSYGLEPRMFYRQASLFVGYLRDLSSVRFGLFILAIEDGKDFEKAFRSIYDISINEAWEDFVIELRNKQQRMFFGQDGIISRTARAQGSLRTTVLPDF